jgi:hypothetical protein
MNSTIFTLRQKKKNFPIQTYGFKFWVSTHWISSFHQLISSDQKSNNMEFFKTLNLFR